MNGIQTRQKESGQSQKTKEETPYFLELCAFLCIPRLSSPILFPPRIKKLQIEPHPHTNNIHLLFMDSQIEKNRKRIDKTTIAFDAATRSSTTTM